MRFAFITILLLAIVGSVSAADLAVTTEVARSDFNSAGTPAVHVGTQGVGVAGVFNNGVIVGGDFGNNSVGATAGYLFSTKNLWIGPVGRVARHNNRLETNLFTIQGLRSLDYGGGLAFNFRGSKWVKPLFTVEYMRGGNFSESPHRVTVRAGFTFGNRK